MRRAVTKAGEYGTLTLYRIRYTDDSDAGCPVFSFRWWCYDREHVLDRWDEGDRDGWRIVSIDPVREQVA